MNPKLNRKRIALVFAGAAAVTAGTIGGAAALSADDDAQDRPIPASELERAQDAALDKTGGGTVTGTEVDDEESRYEVEVTLDDGTEVDVQLNEDFQVVSTDHEESEGESAGDDG